MKTILHLELNADNAEGAQKIIEDLCKELGRKNLLGSYRYEIEAPEGPVTERCVLSDGKVIA